MILTDYNQWQALVFWACITITAIASGLLLLMLFYPRGFKATVAPADKIKWRDIIWGVIPLLILIGLMMPTAWGLSS